nr:tetratricopeptide repeat domain protein [Rickettsia felis]
MQIVHSGIILLILMLLAICVMPIILLTVCLIMYTIISELKRF